MRRTACRIAARRHIPALLAAVIAAPVSAATPGPSTFDAGAENRSGLTFSPDGTTAFWAEWNGKWGSSNAAARTIYTARWADGSWSAPEPAPFSGHHSDDDPFVSPDGRWLYFVSDRPVDESDRVPDTNIWRYALANGDRLEYLSVNSDASEYSPVPTNSGAIYFASDRHGGLGQGDIYMARPLADDFAPPERLGPAINRHTGEWNLWVAPDESHMLFEASSRPGNVSVPGDIYASWRTAAGWTAALPVAALNSDGSDLLPRLHPDGTTLFYTTAPLGGHARIQSADWRRLRAELRSDYAPTLLVANRSSHELVFVDLALGETTTRLATGEGPHLLSNVNQGRVLATGYGEFPKPHAEPVDARPPFVEALNSRVTAIDVDQRSILFDTELENCARPHASWIVLDRAYVTCEDEQRVLVLDLEHRETVGHFDTRQQGSHVIGFDAQSRQLAVTNTESGSLALIGIDDGGTRIVELEAGSEGLLVVEGAIWVGNAVKGSVSVVDAASARVTARIDSVCSFPIALGRDAGQHVWVACFGSAEIVAIDLDTHDVKHRIGLDDQPLNIVLHPDRELAYVSLPRQNAVAEIDLVSGLEVRRIRVGIEPDGLRWAAD